MSADDMNNNQGHLEDHLGGPYTLYDQDEEDPTRQVRNLIVNYIPNAVDETGLRSLFTPIGAVESVKIIVDKSTGVSLGYGFVVFENAVDAERAVEALNGHEIASKKLKVGYAHAGRKDNSHLYVAGLDKSYTKEDIVKIFSVYGIVEEVKILREPGTTISRGVSFVHFSNRREAEAAILALNDSALPGTTNLISVKFADQKKKHGQRPPIWGHLGPQGMYGVNPNLYPYPQSLNQYPPQPMQQGLGMSLGMGQQGIGLGGLGLGGVGNGAGNGGNGGNGGNVGFGRSQGGGLGGLGHHLGYGDQVGEAATLFVFNLPQACDEPLLFSLFSPFGQVASVKVVRDPATRLCKGFGFVSYARHDEAMHAVSQLNGSSLYGKILQVSFKKANSGHGGGDMMGY